MSARVRAGDGPTVISRRRLKAVFVVGPDVRERGRVAAALRGVSDRLDQYGSLDNVPVPAESCAVILVAASVSMEDLVSIERYRSLDEATTLLWCMDLADRSVRRLASLAKAGVDDVIDISHNDLHDLRSNVDQRLSHTLDAVLVRQCIAGVGKQVRSICGWCLRNSYRNIKVADVARHFDTVAEVLNRVLHRHGVASLRYVVRASRLLCVAQELELRSRSGVAVAHALEFSSPKNLSMFVRRSARIPLRRMVTLGPLDVARPYVAACIRRK